MDLMRRRRELLRGKMPSFLPSGYQQVEWVQGNGGYIDTGYISTVNTDLLMEYSLLNLQPDANFFGASPGSEHQSINAAYSSQWYIHNGGYYTNNVDTIRGVGFTLNVPHTIELRKNVWRVDDAVAVIWRTIRTREDLSGYLFAWNNNGTASKTSNYLQVRRFQLYESDVLVLDFVPCYRKSDGEIGMYNTVSKTFFTNAGTGTFLKGADV